MAHVPLLPDSWVHPEPPWEPLPLCVSNPGDGIRMESLRLFLKILSNTDCSLSLQGQMISALVLLTFLTAKGPRFNLLISIPLTGKLKNNTANHCLLAACQQSSWCVGLELAWQVLLCPWITRRDCNIQLLVPLVPRPISRQENICWMRPRASCQLWLTSKTCIGCLAYCPRLQELRLWVSQPSGDEVTNQLLLHPTTGLLHLSSRSRSVSNPPHLVILTTVKISKHLCHRKSNELLATVARIDTREFSARGHCIRKPRVGPDHVSAKQLLFCLQQEILRMQRAAIMTTITVATLYISWN